MASLAVLPGHANISLQGKGRCQQGLCTRGRSAGCGLWVLTGTPGSPEGPASPSSPALPCMGRRALGVHPRPSARDRALASPPPEKEATHQLSPLAFGPCSSWETLQQSWGSAAKSTGEHPTGRGAPTASVALMLSPSSGAPRKPCALTGSPLGPFSPGAPLRPASPCRDWGEMGY